MSGSWVRDALNEKKWTSGWNSKAQLQSDLRSQLDIVRETTHGNRWWMVAVNRQTGNREILLMLLSGSCGGRRRNWGYKEIPEWMGPGDYDCPLSFFDLVPPPPPGAEWAIEWRAKTRIHQGLKHAPCAVHNDVYGFGSQGVAVCHDCGRYVRFNAERNAYELAPDA